ncbi:MAG: hypothetical protein ABWW65_06155 [Thermoprotei archaeon]
MKLSYVHTLFLLFLVSLFLSSNAVVFNATTTHGDQLYYYRVEEFVEKYQIPDYV